MKHLKIIKAKPNPLGKDKTRQGYATPTQLGGEWIDTQNTGSSLVSLADVEVNHKAFSPDDREGKWAVVCVLSGYLCAGEVLRLHSGQTRDESFLAPADRAGAHRHAFTGRDEFVWNNAEGDNPALWDLKEQGFIDGTAYAPNPPEGVVLVCNSAGVLVPSAAAALSR